VSLTSAVVHRLHDLGILYTRGARGGCILRRTIDDIITRGRNTWCTSEGGSDTRAKVGLRPPSSLAKVPISADAAPIDKVSQDLTAPPSLYVFNAIESLTAEMSGYNLEVAVITETNLKTRQTDG